ncbi:hypothetical protein PV416_38180 [Streptomyces ipomoeae]|uniref:hypothetical protein n=1 Tax=Streptomyces ipomoeae TaxID=103232 RepID=UPI001146B0C7|nr:hypothetical protein [Streptomyces ipomoeae]MDX2826745.1 hypothetical protein [Streptomyces ipomoeae]MDX2879378.1 hypothetical protein [Streptomyces ipomoeae]TQE19721.1 hypothetical protein Sipo7851_43355 [Streptomyces ipomoeae]
MRVRVTTTVLGLTAVTVLALPACSTHSIESKPATSSATPVNGERQAAPLSSAALERLLLDESDLGSGYTRTPERPAQHDDVTVLGCAALDKLGSDAATGGSLNFPRTAKASFTYTGDSDSAVSEELYSDTADKLSDGTGRIFAAMTGCPEYQILAGSTVINVSTQQMSAPQLGDERWSMLLTFSADGRDSVVKQTAIRSGNVLLTVSGSPALVDRHLDKALAKATASR